VQGRPRRYEQSEHASVLLDLYGDGSRRGTVCERGIENRKLLFVGDSNITYLRREFPQKKGHLPAGTNSWLVGTESAPKKKQERRRSEEDLGCRRRGEKNQGGWRGVEKRRRKNAHVEGPGALRLTGGA